MRMTKEIESDRNAPIISVIMPTLGVNRSIFSAISTTLRALGTLGELIVICDQGGPLISSLLKLVDHRLRIVIQNTPRGIVGALNQGLLEASGEFVARMDDDDLCLPWRFRSQVKVMRKLSLDIVFGNAVLFGEGIRWVRVLPQIPSRVVPERVGEELASRNPFVHGTMLAKRASMLELGGYRYCVAEDYDLWIRAAIFGLQIYRMPMWLIAYRVHRSQLTSQPDYQSRLKVDPEIIDSLKGLALAIKKPATLSQSRASLQLEVFWSGIKTMLLSIFTKH